MKQGDKVKLVPTQGGHQKDKAGEIVRTTKTLMFVKVEGEMAERTFKIDGQPHGPKGEEFPRYVAKATGETA